MESIPISLIENSNNQYDYSYMSGLSIPSTRPYEQIENELNKGIKFEEVCFKKKNNDKMIIYVLTKDKKRFISNEITFSKLKKRNNLRFEDIDTFINEINKINESDFSVYLEKMDIIRIKYRYLQKNNNNVSIVFIAKDEKTIKNNNNNNIIINDINSTNDINDINNINNINFDNNINNNKKTNQINFDNNNNENKNILNNLKEEINKLANSFLILEENYKKREKLSNVNSYFNTLKNSINHKIPSILYKKNSTISTVSKLLKKDQNKLDLELLFSLKRDGDNIEKFHELVNKIKPTLLFFETYDKQYYFYYIDESWENENTNSDYQIKLNDKMFLYHFNHKEKYGKKLAIYCCKNYGPMIGEYNENDVEFINNLDFDCSISLEKVFTSKKNIFTTANNFNQFYLKELEIYSLNIYN